MLLANSLHLGLLQISNFLVECMIKVATLYFQLGLGFFCSWDVFV